MMETAVQGNSQAATAAMLERQGAVSEADIEETATPSRHRTARVSSCSDANNSKFSRGVTHETSRDSQ